MTTEHTRNIDLVVEVVDALLHPTFDADHHGDHVAAIREYLDHQPIDAAREELREASAIFLSREGKVPMDFVFNREGAADDIADRLKERLPPWPIYLYHATAASRLRSIAKTGLQPAFRQSKWKKRVGSTHLEKGVFFTTSWRSAINWGPIQSLEPRGSLKKQHTVAVIRVRAESLTFEKDSLATQEDCVVVEGSVSVIDASYFEGCAKGIPVWQPLEEAS